MNFKKQDFLNSRRIAFFGVSRSERKMGNTIFRAMQRFGYELFPVHPTLTEFEGIVCYQKIEQIPFPIEGVLINVSPEKTLPIIREALQVDVRKFWLQQGAESEEAIQFGILNDLILITGVCILTQM